MMSWFGLKKKEPVVQNSETWEKPTSPPIAILDGDENVSTPVEDPNLGKLARLHPFSPVAISLVQRFDRDDFAVQEIATLIESDPALAAETLAFVNSAFFARRDRVAELLPAIVIMGAENTKSLVATLAMRAMLKSAPKPAVTRRIWRHSFGTAVIASELAPIYGVSADLASAAGILHDVGRIGLLARDGEPYGHLILKQYENIDAILGAEHELCGMDHCEAGSYLARVWALPDVFHEVAEAHHHTKSHAGITGLIHLACSMADDMTLSAVSHRDVLPLSERVAGSVPEMLRDQVTQSLAGFERRIMDKVDALDF
jgi:putative nucleotidyltransferase with HDIG domain